MIRILTADEVAAFMATHPEITRDVILENMNPPAGDIARAAGLHIYESGHTYLIAFDRNGVLRILDISGQDAQGNPIDPSDPLIVAEIGKVLISPETYMPAVNTLLLVAAVIGGIWLMNKFNK